MRAVPTRFITSACAWSCLLAVAVVAVHASEEAITPSAVGGLHCIVMPSAVVDVASGVSGRVKRVHAERGDTVRADQVLAALESDVERATLELAKVRAELDADIRLHEARLAFERRKLERATRLRVDSMISEQEQDQVETDARLARWQLRRAIDDSELAGLEMARAAEVLKRRSVRSPIDGIVVERFKWPGEYVDEEPILRVARVDPLWVEVIAPVAMHGELRKDMLAEVMIETAPGGTREARVTVVDPMADAASGTFRVRMELPNPDKSLLSGTKCKAHFPKAARYAPKAMDEPPAHETTSAIDPAPALDAASPRGTGPMDRPRAAEAMSNDTETGAADHYIVLTPRLDSDAERRKLAAALGNAGVDDFQIMLGGPYEGRISLGVYSLQHLAERHRSRLAALGFEAETLRHAFDGPRVRVGSGSGTPPPVDGRQASAAPPGRSDSNGAGVS